MLRSLERTAGVAGDITGAVYRRFYARAPDAEGLMEHVDPHMPGRMGSGRRAGPRAPAPRLRRRIAMP